MVVGVSLGISGPLAVVAEVSVSVSEVAVGVRSISLGGGIKTLGDGVQTSGGSEGDTSDSVTTEVVGVSGPLAIVVGNGKSSLGHWVKTLGDGAQTSRRTKGNPSVGDAVSVRESVAVAVEGISLGLDGHNKGSSEERLEHVAASLLTQTENPHV